MKPTIEPVIPAIILLDELGIVSPNSTKIDRAAARLLMTPEFWRSGITIRELKKQYIEQCSLYLQEKTRNR